MKYLLTLVLLFISSIAYSKCDSNNFDQCKTCDQLDKAIVLSEPDKGDYYRGAFWNGLYASYVRNCQGVAKKLLDNGATPSIGGGNYALPLIIAGKWPHENIAINEEWKDLLIRHGVNINLIPDGNKSPYEVYINNRDWVDYENIWNDFMSFSKPGPIDISRNIEWCADKSRMPVLLKVLDMCTQSQINLLDDNISPASDIADVVLSSCKDDFKFVTDAILCQALMDTKNMSKYPKEQMFKEMETKTFNDLLAKRRITVIKKVLEIRSSKRG